MQIESKVIGWLLAGDAAIRRQVLQDVLERPARLYNPKWTSTTYTMLLFRDFGLLPTTRQAHTACELLLDEGLRSDGGVNFGSDRSETCITGMVLSIVAYFRHKDERLDEIVKHLLRQQMPDGGWNCRRPRAPRIRRWTRRSAFWKAFGVSAHGVPAALALRDGAARHAQPMEYAARPTSPSVVGRRAVGAATSTHASYRRDRRGGRGTL